MEGNLAALESTAHTGSNLFDGTQHISGSDTYLSASVDHTIALRTSGSILPSEGGQWDIGSEENPFRDLWITSESLKFSSREIKEGKKKEENINTLNAQEPITLDFITNPNKNK